MPAPLGILGGDGGGAYLFWKSLLKDGPGAHTSAVLALTRILDFPRLLQVSHSATSLPGPWKNMSLKICWRSYFTSFRTGFTSIDFGTDHEWRDPVGKGQVSMPYSLRDLKHMMKHSKVREYQQYTNLSFYFSKYSSHRWSPLSKCISA